jgi:hypothetical protein
VHNIKASFKQRHRSWKFSLSSSLSPFALYFFFVYLSFEALSLKAHVIFGCVYPRVDIEDGFLYPLSKKC